MHYDFDKAFAKLTGNAPFPWQRALFKRFLAGNIPSSCDIPTGLGKTAVIAVWLLARAAGASLPRRLVYVVNRRTVVDQTTDEVERIRANCTKAGIEEDLAVSTLRGQMADNRAWSADPSRPAVICGTVDMIGSRLLFSGYRIGFRSRPLHAGFLGQDALIVHDEAHLEPAFQQLLETIQQEQKLRGDRWPLSVMALTATSRHGHEALQLSDEDRAHPVVAQRVRATKRLSLHQHAEKCLVEEVVAQALTYATSGRAVLVFLRAVDDVSNTVERLRKAGVNVQQLTGTMRGFERDRLVASDEVFRRFLPGGDASSKESPKTVYLVCTSAGEVGVNLSADHLVCDLSTFDSMAQRFGRVNRFGARTDCEIHLFHPESSVLDDDKPKDARNRLATLGLLRILDGDASPAALGALDPEARRAAFAPEPRMLLATDILFDAWTMTTVPGRLPGRPPVAPYLHGVAEWEPPSTQVAWRDEVDLVAGELLELYPAQEMIEDYPLKPHELLADRTSRVLDTLEKIAAKVADPKKVPVWVVSEDGTVDATVTLDGLVDGDRKWIEPRIAGCTLLLPPKHCRPVSGALSADGVMASSHEAGDVADAWLGEGGVGLRARVLGEANTPAGMRLIRSVVLDTREELGEAQDGVDDEKSTGGASAKVWRWYEVPRAADNDGSRSASEPVLLDTHTADIEREAARIVKTLELGPSEKQAVMLAAKIHDQGKRRRVWQRSIGNINRQSVLAKSGAAAHRFDITRYRHELGSVLDAEREGMLAGLDPETRDLVLHLVAAHHGRARPHFPAEELFDPEAAGADFQEFESNVVTRFATLQARFGRWGLAYLESLLRAADYAASAEPSATVEAER